MPQDSVTGRQGAINGFNLADQIGALLGAVRLANNSNEFRWNGRTVVIKTGPAAVVTRAMLARVAAIVYGEETATGWLLYEVDPARFEQLSVTSQSSNHDDNYRLVRRAQLRTNGRLITL